MKSIILTAIFLFSASVFANPAMSVCQEMWPDSEVRECMSIVRGNHFDEAATKVCSGMWPAQEVKNCLSAISNKEFDSAELKICSGMWPASESVSCLQDSAIAVQERNSCARSERKLDRIERLARGVLRDIENLNFLAVTDKLLTIIDISTREERRRR